MASSSCCRTNTKAHLPGPLQELVVARNRNAAPVRCSAWFGGSKNTGDVEASQTISPHNNRRRTARYYSWRPHFKGDAHETIAESFVRVPNPHLPRSVDRTVCRSVSPHQNGRPPSQTTMLALRPWVS